MKTIKFFSQFTATALLIGLFSVFAAAQTGDLGFLNTASSQLQMDGFVQPTLQLNISTGAGGATVVGKGNLFQVSLGSMNAMGFGTPAPGVSVTPIPGAAIYTTPINVTPIYSGFGGQTANITVAAGTSGDEDIALEGDSPAAMVGMTGAPRTVVVGAQSGSSNQRFVGFIVPQTELIGLKTATFVYTVSVNLD